jgi:hypothetical protein
VALRLRADFVVADDLGQRAVVLGESMQISLRVASAIEDVGNNAGAAVALTEGLVVGGMLPRRTDRGPRTAAALMGTTVLTFDGQTMWVYDMRTLASTSMRQQRFDHCGCTSLAVEPSGQHVYWTVEGESTIFRATTSGLQDAHVFFSSSQFTGGVRICGFDERGGIVAAACSAGAIYALDGGELEQLHRCRRGHQLGACALGHGQVVALDVTTQELVSMRVRASRRSDMVHLHDSLALARLLPSAGILGSDRMADSTLVTDEGDVLPVHRAVVCAGCEVLDRMLSSCMVEGTERAVRLHGIGARAARAVLQWIYTGRATCDTGDLVAVFAASRQLMLWGLHELCAWMAHRTLSVENCVDWLVACGCSTPAETTLRSETLRFVGVNLHAILLRTPDAFARLAAQGAELSLEVALSIGGRHAWGVPLQVPQALPSAAAPERGGKRLRT